MDSVFSYLRLSDDYSMDDVLNCIELKFKVDFESKHISATGHYSVLLTLKETLLSLSHEEVTIA